MEGRRAKYEKMTTTADSPYPQVRIRDPLDVNLTLLLSLMDPQCRLLKFEIQRDHKNCRTPRRNPDVDKALSLLHDLEKFGESLRSYLVNEMFFVQTDHGLDVVSLNDDAIFVPTVPVLDAHQPAHDDYQTQQSILVSPTAVSSEAGLVLSAADQTRFLDEQKRSLVEKFSGLAKVFPDGVKIVTVAEANIVVAAVHLQTLSHYLEAGVSYLEELLRKQIVSAIGKSVSAVDFANYMNYHNSRIFREEYRPVPFSYAIRRPEHTPEGLIAIEASLNDGSIPQPVPTLVASSDLNEPMQFSIAASAKVAFTGQVHLHGLMMHQFEGDSGLTLKLNARARQFSSFLVLVGRISGPGLFDPQFGMICQNKDEISIPLDIETIPSAGEFKAATISISPEQQAFAKMFRGMQLSSTLFAVCVVQIKPQLEKLLNLHSDALTKEIELTQNLLESFIQYQIPSDLLSYGGGSPEPSVRVEAVRRNLRKMQLLVESEKLKQLLDSLDEAEKRAYEKLAEEHAKSVTTTITLSSSSSSGYGSYGPDRGGREGGGGGGSRGRGGALPVKSFSARGGKVAKAHETITKNSPAPPKPSAPAPAPVQSSPPPPPPAEGAKIKNFCSLSLFFFF